MAISDHCATSKMLTLPFFMVESWNFYHRSLACSMLKNSGQKFSNWLLAIFDHCATSKMLTLPIFMLECWNFHQRPLACSISKHSGQKIFKLTFGHFWPLCNIKNANFAIFHARKLKFSPETPCLLNFKTQWSEKFQIDFWPFLTTVQHQEC